MHIYRVASINKCIRYLDNMVWQIKELQKRFINKNYILNEIVSIYCTLYHFHVENMQRYPMNTEMSLNWIRGYYELVMKPYEEYITETMLLQAFANVAAGQNIAAKAETYRDTGCRAGFRYTTDMYPP